MGTRTIRLDEKAERALAEVQEATGLQVSEILRRGLFTLRQAVLRDASNKAWETYQALSIEDDGLARAPARRAKEGIREILTRKQPR